MVRSRGEGEEDGVICNCVAHDGEIELSYIINGVVCKFRLLDALSRCGHIIAPMDSPSGRH